jgi:hypothetical protein
MCGIKVHAAEAPAPREVAEEARRFRRPVIYDVFGRPYLTGWESVAVAPG